MQRPLIHTNSRVGKMFRNWTKKEKFSIISIILIVFLGQICLHIFSLTLLYNGRDTATEQIREEVSEARSDVREKQEIAENYYSKGEDYKKENEELRKELERLSSLDTANTANTDCYMKFMKQSYFLDSYTDYNKNFYLSNVDFYDSLVLYESKLEDYRKAIRRDMHRPIISPMLITDFHSVGGEINVSVPITSRFLIAGGVGYFDKWYLKIGAGFRL